MIFLHEALWWTMTGEKWPASGHFESSLESHKRKPLYQHVIPVMRGWRLYHFHDTSGTALVKQIHTINDNEYLRDDARNLAAFLLRLKNHHAEHHQRIVKTIRLVAPFFGDFHLRATVDNQEKIQLEW